MCFRFHQKPKAVQTVKLTLDHRNPKVPTSVIYRSLIHRMNQTAHISLHLSSISKSNTKSPKQDRCANFPARPPHNPSRCPRLSEASNRLSGPSQRLSAVSPVRLSSAGRGGSKYNSKDPQALNYKNHIFFGDWPFGIVINRLRRSFRRIPQIFSPDGCRRF